MELISWKSIKDIAGAWRRGGAVYCGGVHCSKFAVSRQCSSCIAPSCPALPHRCAVRDAGDGGVIKTVVKEGSGWAKPQSLDEVCVR